MKDGARRARRPEEDKQGAKHGGRYPKKLKNDIYRYSCHLSLVSHTITRPCGCLSSAPQIGLGLTLAHLPHLESSQHRQSFAQLWLRWEFAGRPNKLLI